MTDTLTTALRSLARDVVSEDGVAVVVILQAAGEIERLREELVDAKKWAMSERSQRWALPTPLTDAERAALWTAAEAYAENNDDPECERIAVALHGLWERTK